MSTLARFQQVYAGAVAALGAALMAATVAVMIAQVFYRYVLGDSLIWAEELCRYFLIWMTFLFAGAALQRGDLVALELLTSRFSARTRVIVMAPAYVLTAAFLFVLVYHGWNYAAQNRIQAMPAADFIAQALFARNSGLSIFWVYLSVPVGCTILALHFLASALRLTTEARGPAA